jgi:hypothetical protein
LSTEWEREREGEKRGSERDSHGCLEWEEEPACFYKFRTHH